MDSGCGESVTPHEAVPTHENEESLGSAHMGGCSANEDVSTEVLSSKEYTPVSGCDEKSYRGDFCSCGKDLWAKLHSSFMEVSHEKGEAPAPAAANGGSGKCNTHGKGTGMFAATSAFSECPNSFLDASACNLSYQCSTFCR